MKTFSSNHQKIEEVCKELSSKRYYYLINFVLILLVFIAPNNAQTPVGANGKLSISGSQMVNQNGEAIQLRGMSSHGPQWFGECYNYNSMNVLVNDWGIDIFRLAMYVEENGYVTNPGYWRAWIDDMVDLCGQYGVYCLIDWHVLTPGDPNSNINEAKEFWDYMSAKHAGKEHVIYEICNEPNGVEWPRVKEYADVIIPIIRANDPNTIIIVGTPNWSQDVDKAAESPLAGDNIMYALHFYSGTHLSWLRDKAAAAMNAGIALFVTEFGTSQASGDGGPYIEESDRWMTFMENNKISWCNWSYAEKDEVSAALKPGSCGSDWNNTSISGEYIKGKILHPADSWEGTGGNIPPTVNILAPTPNGYFEVGDEITVQADASDSDGTIEKVEFFANNAKIGEATTLPYSINWVPTVANTYQLTAIATDNENGSNASLKVTTFVVVEIIQDPYPDASTPHPVPGELLAINYDQGGEGIAYHDADAANKGVGGIRSDEGVDTEPGDGTGNVGYVNNGEWLEFTVNVNSTDTYSMVLRYASQPGGGRFHLEFDGVDKTGPVDVGSSGSWGSYQEITVEGISLKAGIQVMRMAIDKGDFNFSKFTFEGGGHDIPVTGIEITPPALTINKGQERTLSALISPENATNKSVIWSTDNASVASINSQGVVIGNSEGIATITAISSVPSIRATCEVTVTDITLPVYSLAAGTTGTGAVVLTPPGGSYEEGTVVTMEAVPGSGFIFSEWQGDASGTNAVYTITMDSDKNVTAKFVEHDTGGDCDNPVSVSLPYEADGAQTLCLETSGTIDYINSWNADKIEINGVDITNNYTGTMPARIDGKYRIYYEASVAWAHIEIVGENDAEPKQYSLNTQIVGQGSVEPANGNYNEGTVVNLTAIPEAGWEFSGWGEDAAGTNATASVAMDTNKLVVATFTEIINPTYYNLTINVAGGGSVTMTPGGGEYLAGTEVDIVAIAHEGYIFSGWSGDITGSSASTSVIMDEHKNVTATFIVDDGGSGCQFDSPLATALPSINQAFDYVHVIGDGPDLSTVSNFTINWDLANNGLWQFSMNTTDGNPDWYNNLISASTHDFSEISPSVAISGSGFPGLDGDYWATLDAGNFVLIDKMDKYIIYFSNTENIPCTKAATGNITENSITGILIYPNPASDQITIQNLENAKSMQILNSLGQVVNSTEFNDNNKSVVNIEHLDAGIYFIRIYNLNGTSEIHMVYKN